MLPNTISAFNKWPKIDKFRQTSEILPKSDHTPCHRKQLTLFGLTFWALFSFLTQAAI